MTRAMRIVADHSRGAAFLIADGVVPSNEDRGYILRRIMRRAIQQGRTLGLESPWLGRFAERTIELMGDAYPELVAERETIARWVGDEEESFGRTLERGTELLERLIVEAKESEHLLDRRRRCLQAARHLRLPLRPDQGAAGRAGPLGRRLRLRGADGGAAPARPHRRRHRARLREHARAGRGLRRGGAADPLRRLRDADARPPGSPPWRATTAAPWSSSRRAPSTPRAAARSPTPACCAGTTRRRRVARRLPGRGRSGARDRAGRARRSRPGVRGRGGRRPRRPPRDHAQPHRDPPPARGAARAARHPRAPGRLGGAPRQAALRLHPRAGAQPGGAARRRGPRQRVDQGEPPGALAQHGAGRRRSGSARWPCSARNTASGCGWSRSTASRASSAAAPTSPTRERSASSRSSSEGSSAANVRRVEAITGPAAIDFFRERESQLREAGELLGNPQDPSVALAARPRS